MALSELPLSYCTNVHPGGTVEQIVWGIENVTAPLRARLGQPMGAGLWMTRQAVAQLTSHAAAWDQLVGALSSANVVVYTMNAFPIDDFHARRVKEKVYLPDWSEPARRDHTMQVAELLARLLPDGMEGSLSTSPLALKAFAGSRPLEEWSPPLLEVAEHLDAIRRRTGKTIRLAIEPEPGAILETVEETIEFFDVLMRAAGKHGREEKAREHLGICYDVCHQSVEFEDVAESIRQIDQAGIRIAKVHVTCALELTNPGDAAARTELGQFAEERYLHQTTARLPDGTLGFREDLTADWASHPPDDWLTASSWRTHFHVPIDQAKMGSLGTTRRDLERAIAEVATLEYAPHLEVETYTWPVLPGPFAPGRDFKLLDGLEQEMRSAHELIGRLRGQPTALGTSR